MKFKYLFLLLSAFTLLINCKSSQVIVVNRKIIDTQGDPMLIGRVNREALKAPEFSSWYSNEYNSYIPNQKIIQKLKGRTRLYKIVVFFGTWCSDTHEQLPRFLKVLDETKYPEDKLELYAVNRNKESFYGEQSQKGIQRIPTIIVYKANSEVGRIIETPTQTLELDLYKIIAGKDFEE